MQRDEQRTDIGFHNMAGQQMRFFIERPPLLIISEETAPERIDAEEKGKNDG